MTDEIEITEAMIRAGVARLEELQEFQPDLVYVVREVFLAVSKARIA